MSRQYKLTASIRAESDNQNIDVLDAILSDEEKKVGKRAYYDHSRDENAVNININAQDSTALKAAITAISSIITLAETGLDIK